MKVSIRNVVSVTLLVVVVLGSYALDELVFAGLARTELLMDSSWAWAQVVARLLACLLLLFCAAFVLSPARPNRMVALIYLLVGTYFILLEVPHFAVYLGFDPRTLSGARVALPITAAFLCVIGAAALLRPYVFTARWKA